MERKIKQRNAEGSRKKEKIDTNENGSLCLVEIIKREKRKVSLRVAKSTVILVDPCNNNEEYAEAYRQKHNITK